MNRPYITEEIKRKVRLKRLEEEKEALKRHREFVLEQQKQAFMKSIINEELEEENGMSM